MGHAYIVAEGCEEASVLGVCSSSDEGLMDSLMSLHGPEEDPEAVDQDQEAAGSLPAVRDLRHGERRANRHNAGRRKTRAAH